MENIGQSSAPSPLSMITNAENNAKRVHSDNFSISCRKWAYPKSLDNFQIYKTQMYTKLQDYSAGHMT